VLGGARRGPLRRPGAALPPAPSSKRAYQRVAIPTLVIEGACDKLLPPGWAKEIVNQLPQAIGRHRGRRPLPQLEQPSDTNALLLRFLSDADASP